MQPEEFDYEFPRGDTCPIKFDLVDKNKEPLDISRVTEIYFTVKKNYSNPDSILQKRYSLNQITAEGNTASLILTHDDTKQLNYGRYVYDIQVVSGSYVKTIVLGEITLTNESTHYNNE